MTMHWYDTAWKLTTDLWVWNSAWTPVQECYIWDGGYWKLCFTSAASLDSFVICDTSHNPSYGNFTASWTYTTATPENWKIALYYSFDSGSTWTALNTNISITSSPYDGTVEGLVGFSSLDDTYFKLRMIDVTTSTIDATNSPRYQYPAYIYC